MRERVSCVYLGGRGSVCRESSENGGCYYPLFRDIKLSRGVPESSASFRRCRERVMRNCNEGG